jgi:hypothetical protein
LHGFCCIRPEEANARFLNAFKLHFAATTAAGLTADETIATECNRQPKQAEPVALLASSVPS